MLVAAVLALIGGAIGTGFTVSSSASPAPTSAAGDRSVTTGQGGPVPSTGCTLREGPPVSDELQGLMVGGAPRWYLLTTPDPATSSPRAGGGPSDLAGPRPLVLDFHGLAESALLQSGTSRFGALGQQDGFVVVTPSGTGDPAHWDTTDHTMSNPDLQFVAALLDQVEATQCIDTSRVYAAGFSDGAVMASQLACTMSWRFAAIGAVSGLALQAPCDPGQPVPVIAFHGTADPILYFNGGVDSPALTQLLGPDEPAAPAPASPRPAQLDGPGVPAIVRAWAAKDRCNPRAIDTRVDTQVIVRRFACPPGTDVRFYIVLGGGHEWPGSTVSDTGGLPAGRTTVGVDATDQMWEFFQQFQQ